MESPSFYMAPQGRARGWRSNRKARSEDQSLFESRERDRKIRVLIDGRTLSSDSPGDSDDILRFFLKSDLVQAWHVMPPFPHISERRGEKLSTLAPPARVRELTGTQGRFEGFGITYGYSLGSSDSNKFTRSGQFTIQDPQIVLSFAGIDIEKRDERESLLADVKESFALKELAVAINADVVITEEFAGNQQIGSLLGYSRSVSRADAVKILAHYFRTQGHYVTGIDPHEELDSGDYYTYAVYAFAPHLHHWLGKTVRAIEFFGEEHSSHEFYADIAISRCSRALRRYDDLLVYLGRPWTNTNIDDAIDTLDHILVSLCAAIDALARSIGSALETGPKIPKLHDKNWVKDYLKPVYGDVPEYDRLLECRIQIGFLFKFRNSIHSLGLMPYFDENPQTSAAHRSLRVVIPPTSKDAWERMDVATRNNWGLVESGSIAHADLHVFAQKCFESAFAFIDVLTEIVSFEPIRDKSPVLYENVLKPEDPKAMELAEFIASVNNFDSPHITGKYAPDEKRKLKTDLRSHLVRYLERALRKSGWRPRPDYKPVRQPPMITTYFKHRQWRN